MSVLTAHPAIGRGSPLDVRYKDSRLQGALTGPPRLFARCALLGQQAAG